VTYITETFFTVDMLSEVLSSKSGVHLAEGDKAFPRPVLEELSL